MKAKRRCTANDFSRPSRKHFVLLLVHLRISLDASSFGGDKLRLRKREGSFPTQGKLVMMVEEFDAISVSEVQVGRNVSSLA